MATENLYEPLKVGTLVKIRNSGYHRAGSRKTADCSARTVRVYRVLVQRKPRPVYIEVLEEQLDVLNVV